VSAGARDGATDVARGRTEGDTTMTSVGVSEIFLSIQGEGPSAGTPAHFVRLQGCDVGCHWCDSKYTWSPAAGQAMALEDTWARARALGEAPLLVVTGGEPLQHPGIDALLVQALER